MSLLQSFSSSYNTKLSQQARWIVTLIKQTLKIDENLYLTLNVVLKREMKSYDLLRAWLAVHNNKWKLKRIFKNICDKYSSVFTHLFKKNKEQCLIDMTRRCNNNQKWKERQSCVQKFEKTHRKSVFFNSESDNNTLNVTSKNETLSEFSSSLDIKTNVRNVLDDIELNMSLHFIFIVVQYLKIEATIIYNTKNLLHHDVIVEKRETSKSQDDDVTLSQLKALQLLLKQELAIDVEKYKIWYLDDDQFEFLQICENHSFDTALKKIHRKKWTWFRFFLTRRVLKWCV